MHEAKRGPPYQSRPAGPHPTGSATGIPEYHAMPRPLRSAAKVGQERVKEGPEEHRGILLTEDAKVTLDEVV